MNNMYMKLTTHKNGFTLTEILVTVLIIGVMASLALPRYGGVIERVRSAEGAQILSALLGAQKAYELEYGTYANQLTDLDIEIDRAQYFNTGSIGIQDNNNNLASIQRTGGYTLSIDEDGVISCTDGAITCATAGY